MVVSIIGNDIFYVPHMVTTCFEVWSKPTKFDFILYFGSSLKSMGRVFCNMIEIRDQEMEEDDTDRNERHGSFSVGFGFETAVASGVV